jgi:hypothetical protein
MIIVKLIGGLGNQLFQYATAKALAHRHGVEVKVDSSFLNQNSNGQYTQRNYELGVFTADIKIATETETKIFLKYNNSKWLRVLQRSIPDLFDNLYLAESDLSYFKNFDYLPNNTYLDGFWQNQTYFLNIRSIILNDLQVRLHPSEEIKEIQNKIESTNSISIHVRRGDYVTLPIADNYHGTPDLTYYESAINFMTDKVGDHSVYVFSDDIGWCKKNLRLVQPTYFVEHKEADCWDLFLMSKCQHNIIANSSFSWWAAWLNQHANKVVIAPSKWFTNPLIKHSIIPTDWIQL